MGKSFLIVDDSASMRQLVGFALREAGHEVIEAVNGKDGLGKASAKKVDLVVTDLNMPEMNGIDLIKQLRARPEYKFTPIIMLTTESQESKKQEGQAAGAKAWVVKPFKPDQMLNAVSKLILP